MNNTSIGTQHTFYSSQRAEKAGIYPIKNTKACVNNTSIGIQHTFYSSQRAEKAGITQSKTQKRV